MENIIYTDADLNAFLIANEEQTGNTIAVVIEADATASQELTITSGEATTTETVTPSTKNRIEIPSISKREGGEWGLENLPEEYHGLLREALSEYRGEMPGYDISVAKDYAIFCLSQIRNTMQPQNE